MIDFVSRNPLLPLSLLPTLQDVLCELLMIAATPGKRLAKVMQVCTIANAPPKTLTQGTFTHAGLP